MAGETGGLLEQGFHGLSGKERVPVPHVSTLTDMPDGKQAGKLVRRQVLLENVEGFSSQFLICFDGGTHGIQDRMLGSSLPGRVQVEALI